MREREREKERVDMFVCMCREMRLSRSYSWKSETPNLRQVGGHNALRNSVSLSSLSLSLSLSLVEGEECGDYEAREPAGREGQGNPRSPARGGHPQEKPFLEGGRGGPWVGRCNKKGEWEGTTVVMSPFALPVVAEQKREQCRGVEGKARRGKGAAQN